MPYRNNKKDFRILIFATDSFYSQILIKELIDKYKNNICGIYLSKTYIGTKNLPLSCIYIIRKRMEIFFFFKLIDMLIYKLIGNKNLRLKNITKKHLIPIFKTKNINSKNDVRKIRRLHPDLVISIYFNQHIKKKLLKIPTRGSINIHPSLLPRDRGLMPYVWQLYNKDKESGITVHYINEKFDEGDIILQRKVKISKGDSIATLYYKCCLVGKEILVKSIEGIKNGNIKPRKQNKNGTYHLFPSNKVMLNLFLRGIKFFKLKDFKRLKRIR